jgi:hypothetical protein
MRIRILALASAVLLGIIAICGPASSASAQDAKVAKVRKPPSVCVGLDKSACGAKSECYWRKATLLKSGKTRRAHCRIRRSASKKAPAA